MSIIAEIIFILIGFVLLEKGAEFLVDSSSNIAKRFHIPEMIIGLTIVSMGTSIPELFISISSALKGHSDIQIGNVIGSNICNLLLILGISALIKPLKFKKETRLIEIPISLIITIIFAIICNTDNVITTNESIFLIFLFIIFIIYTFVMAKKGLEFDDEEPEKTIEDTKKNSNVLKNIFFIILGIVALRYGGNLVVDNAAIVAEYFNISEKIISLTIIAIGTSLPELVTSIVAALKGNSDISIGNIIGSNIFNILLVIGTSSFITSIQYNPDYNIEISILIFANILLALFPVLKPKNEMSKGNGATYLILYLVYLAILLQV